MTNVNNFRVIDFYPLFLLFSLRCFRQPKRMCIGAQKYIICQKRKTFCQVYHSAYIISTYLCSTEINKNTLTFVIMTIVVFTPENNREIIHDICTIVKTENSLCVETMNNKTFEFDPDSGFVIL